MSTSTYQKPAVMSLTSIDYEIEVQEMYIRNHRDDSWYTLEDAKEGLRQAKEAKRVFIYRAKPALTKSGKVIRR